MAPITDAPAPAPDRVAAVIVNYRTPRLALECLDALAAERSAGPADLTAIVVDGGSGDGSDAVLAGGIAERGFVAWVRLLALPVNGGFGFANNQAIQTLAADANPPAFVWLVNPDAAPRLGALTRLLDILRTNSHVAAVGAQLEGEDGQAQGSAFTFPTLRGEFSRGTNTDAFRRLLATPPLLVERAQPGPAPWVTGAAVLFRLSALQDVGLFDDGFFLYFEEVELMHRLRRAGWDIWTNPDARVRHIGGVSTDVRWDETGFHKAAALPPYWYRARRRYFARTAGPWSAVMATLLFVLGRSVWLARCAASGRADRFPKRTARDMLRHGCWPSPADRRAHPPRPSDPRSATPLWMGEA